MSPRTIPADAASAQSINIFTLEFANPEWQPSDTEKQTVSGDISYGSLLQGNSIQTLSTDSISAGGDVEGLLYVPNLAESDPCSTSSKQYVPHNVTRQANLPPVDYYLIAVAPWISAACANSYLSSARSNGARGFLTYLAHDATTTPPPPPTDPAWNIGGGLTWGAATGFPVYALQPSDGAQLMLQLSLYSGNMTDAPNGHLLTEEFDSRNYVRLYTSVDTGSPSQIPSLWVFLLIVLGMFLVIIAITSFLMQYVQKRRRQALRRLIVSGDVDLEALGIKRLQVPQEFLDKLPLFVYVANDETKGAANPVTPSHNTATDTRDEQSATPETDAPAHSIQSLQSVPDNRSVRRRQSDLQRNPPSADTLSHRQLPYSQPTCPICLEDFISHETVVRELPCRHIYHSECIDPLLREYSSLCPVCKGKVLPAGYCPTKVTNAMVRRERLIRRMRERVTIEVGPQEGESGRPLSVGRRMASFHRQFGRSIRSDRRTVVSASTMVFLNNLAERQPANNIVESGNSAQNNVSNSAPNWVQLRTNAIPQLRALHQENTNQETSLPRWRRALHSAFPGFS
ncbi:hypothetical protein MMC18_007049 [Xylographa bjoerkii]|nr:hypothetical protein [Xylographa bjoerkii]